MLTYSQNIPSVFLPQAIAPKGIRAHEFTNYMLGIIDSETNLTVDAASYNPDKKYQLVFKRGHSGAKNVMFPDLMGAKLPVRIPVTRVYKSHLFDKGNEKPKNFVGYLGWDGISNCKSLSLECGQDYGLQITVRGKSVRSVFNRNLTEIIPFTTPCCEECNLDAACDKTIDEIFKAVKNYKLPGSDSYYTLNYVDMYKVKSCCPAESPFDKVDYQVWELVVCDNGTASDLARVQRAYPDYDVVRTHRDAPDSTYEICIPAGQDPQNPVAPAEFVQTKVKALVCGDCPDCPDNLTSTGGGNKVIACISSPFLTVPAEAFTEEYYAEGVDAEAAINSLVGNVLSSLAAQITECGFENGTVLGTTCDDVTIQMCGDCPVEEHEIPGVKLTQIGECTEWCEGTNSLSWCATKPVYKISRTRCISVKKDNCDEGVTVTANHPLYTEVYNSLKNVEGIDLSTFGIRTVDQDGPEPVEQQNDCMVSFQVDQYSSCLEDGCDTFGADGAKFDNKWPAYKGIKWVDCDCENWTIDVDGCPQAPENDTVENCLCGIKFEGKYVYPETALPCTYDIGDDIEREPIEVEVTLIRQYSDNTLCEPMDLDWTVVQRPTMVQGLGQFVARKEILSNYYDLGIYFNPKDSLGNLMQQVSGYEYAAKPNKRYNHIDLYFEADERREYYRHDSPMRHLVQFFVEADNVALMEEIKTFLNKTILSQGLANLL